MKRTQLASLVLVPAMMLIAGQVHGSTIGPECGSCYGNTFTLSYFSVGPSDQYRVALTIDTSGFVAAGTGEWLASVSIKIAPKPDYLSFTSVSWPSNWVSSLAFSAGFITDTNFSPMKLNLPNGTLTWVWDVVVAPGTLFTGPDEASVKVTYTRVGPQGQLQQRKTAESITLVGP